MTTIKDYIKKCEYVKSNILDVQKRIIIDNKQKITNLNKNQFIDGLGSDDKILHNTNPIFTGRYKNNGQLYDFFNTGKFINGLDILFKDKDTFNIFSTGTETTERKYDFFQGYTNLFGLDSYYSNILNWNIIYPELMAYIKKYL